MIKKLKLNKKQIKTKPFKILTNAIYDHETNTCIISHLPNTSSLNISKNYFDHKTKITQNNAQADKMPARKLKSSQKNTTHVPVQPTFP